MVIQTVFRTITIGIETITTGFTVGKRDRLNTKHSPGKCGLLPRSRVGSVGGKLLRGNIQGEGVLANHVPPMGFLLKTGQAIRCHLWVLEGEEPGQISQVTRY